MRTILLLAVNTLKVLSRRKSNIFVYGALPVLVVALALGLSGAGREAPVRVGVADQDGTDFSAGLVRGMSSWGRFTVEAVDLQSLEQRVGDGDLDCGMVIPLGYGEGVLTGSGQPVRLLSTQGETVTAWLEPYVDLYTGSLRDMAVAAAGDRVVFQEMYKRLGEGGVALEVAALPDESTGRRVVSTSVGQLIMFLMLGASFTTQLILAEKRSRTYYRVCSAPVRPRQYILGNGLAAMLIIAIQVLFIQVILKLALRVETYVPDLILFLILFLFGLVAVTLGMLITSFSRSTAVSTGLFTLVLSPTCMLAGCFWPVTFMPPLLQRLALFTPQRWAMDAVQIVQEGGGLGAIVGHLGVIIAFAVAMAIVAAWRFSRTEESGQFV